MYCVRSLETHKFYAQTYNWQEKNWTDDWTNARYYRNRGAARSSLNRFCWYEKDNRWYIDRTAFDKKFEILPITMTLCDLNEESPSYDLSPARE